MHSRTCMMVGDEGVRRLRKAKVAVFGLGGVGSYVVEGLARSGIGHFVLVDADAVAPSNLNRQLIATVPTLGRPKTEAEAERILSINPQTSVEAYPLFYENGVDIDWSGVEYAVDAVDTVAAKLLIIQRAMERGVPVISSMGTARKLDPTRLRVSDIYETAGDPLARVMRRELRKRGVEELKVVYSDEAPLPVVAESEERAAGAGKAPIGSMTFVPGSAGLLISSVVVRDLLAADAC